MIYVGIDDTDVLGARGTNQVAREIVRRASDRWTCRRILRHQLLIDPRIPFTSKNGSASIALEPTSDATLSELISLCREALLSDFLPGSDPGLCVTEHVPAALSEFGLLCQREIVTQQQAYDLSEAEGVFLEGLGGTCGGVIGAIAAVGLAATGNDGRVVQWENWPDDLSGRQPVARVTSRAITVREIDQLDDVTEGEVDVGKHLRPNYRHGRAILYAKREQNDILTAVKLP